MEPRCHRASSSSADSPIVPSRRCRSGIEARASLCGLLIFLVDVTLLRYGRKPKELCVLGYLLVHQPGKGVDVFLPQEVDPQRAECRFVLLGELRHPNPLTVG